MDFYSILKLLHVLTAIAWVGGGLTLLATSIFTVRDGGPAEAIRVTQLTAMLSMRWFVPASTLTFIFGVMAAFVGGMWAEAWVVLGLAGFIATYITGYFVIRVKADRIAALLQEGREADAVDIATGLMRVSKFDYTVVLVVVADMVLKPSWTDFITLGLFAAAIAAGAWFFLFRDEADGTPQAA
jgi:uncharacterized membrane protein